jgi:pimeloyl-ACP methyl ester carboxylesterase
LIISARLAAVLFGTLLLTPLVDGNGSLAAADPATATSAESLISPPPPGLSPAQAHRGRAYLFRGALGPFFSRGIDRLGERLDEAGITNHVYEFTICRLIAAQAIEDYREDPQPIILIGHSMGGLCAVTFAEVLQGEGIRANLVVAIDPAHATSDVPLNVDRFINIFLSKDVLGGGDVKPKPGFRGHYASFDLSQHGESHINIEKVDTIQQQLVTKVLQIALAKGAGDTLPIRYVIPPKEPIELWDSGTSVFARPGDSLQSIATAYHVPLWSVTQINKGADRTPLVPGERVIVPRHLEPLIETSEPVPPAVSNVSTSASRGASTSRQERH